MQVVELLRSSMPPLGDQVVRMSGEPSYHNDMNTKAATEIDATL